MRALQRRKGSKRCATRGIFEHADTLLYLMTQQKWGAGLKPVNENSAVTSTSSPVAPPSGASFPSSLPMIDPVTILNRTDGMNDSGNEGITVDNDGGGNTFFGVVQSTGGSIRGQEEGGMVYVPARMVLQTIPSSA